MDCPKGWRGVEIYVLSRKNCSTSFGFKRDRADFQSNGLLLNICLMMHRTRT